MFIKFSILIKLYHNYVLESWLTKSRIEINSHKNPNALYLLKT